MALQPHSLVAQNSPSSPLVVGSSEHKELFCRFFIETHISFDPAAVEWPELDASSLKLLQSLPVWTEAMETECLGTCTIQSCAALQVDPLIRQAMTLLGQEEARHAAMIQHLTTRYGIPMSNLPPPLPPADAEWEFLRFGYSECFDAFFSCALFAIAGTSGLVPRALVETFEPVIQEEARHVLFFVNWEAYRRAQSPFWQRPKHLGRGALERVFQAQKRLKIALGARTNKNFTLKAHQKITTDITPRQFLELCLAENARRLDPYDPRLIRPRLVPTIAKALCRVLP
ncbi:MAG TPA: ferritin-like domain-containing protein [Candidatus Binatia bacterium]